MKREPNRQQPCDTRSDTILWTSTQMNTTCQGTAEPEEATDKDNQKTLEKEFYHSPHDRLESGTAIQNK